MKIIYRISDAGYIKEDGSIGRDEQSNALIMIECYKH